MTTNRTAEEWMREVIRANDELANQHASNGACDVLFGLRYVVDQFDTEVRSMERLSAALGGVIGVDDHVAAMRRILDAAKDELRELRVSA